MCCNSCHDQKRDARMEMGNSGCIVPTLHGMDSLLCSLSDWKSDLLILPTAKARGFTNESNHLQMQKYLRFLLRPLKEKPKVFSCFISVSFNCP